MIQSDRVLSYFRYLFLGLALVYGVYWILATFVFRDWYMSKPLDQINKSAPQSVRLRCVLICTRRSGLGACGSATA